MEKINKEIRWTAPEYQFYEKDYSWYWLVTIVASILFLFAIWQKNLFFALFIIVATIVIIFWGKRQPQNIEFKIAEKEILIGNKKSYPYEDLAGFALKEGSVKFGDLILKNKSKLSIPIKILIPNKDIPKAKELLSKKLQEVEYNESLSDALSKFIKF